MSQLKKTVLKMAVIGLVLWGGYKWVNHSPENAATAEVMVETTLDKTDAAIDKSGDWVDEKTTAAAEAMERLGIKDKVDALQDKAKPVGSVIKQTVDPNNIPGVKAAGWLDSKTSIPAILLLLVAGGVLSLLALASPASISGGRH